MSPLEVLQLVGYSIGAALPLWMGGQLLIRRYRLSQLEKVLFALALTMGGWHTSNLIITLHGLFGLGSDQWTTLLRLADTVSVISITFAYSFLLHVHLYLWANAADRSLSQGERVRLYLSYLPTILLVVAVPQIWKGAYAPMLTKLAFFVFPFACWITYVLGVVAITEWLIAKRSIHRSEQRIMRTLAGSFVAVGIIILAALAFGVGEGRVLGLYLKTLANLGSLLPSILLAYYIYRYRYLELIIEESLIVASFAAVVLTVYLYGIRTIGDWMTARYGIRTGVIEALLILGLTLAAAPIRGWLERRFHKLFEREAALYRELVSRIGSQAGQYKELPALLQFIEGRTAQALGLRRVHIALAGNDSNASTGNGNTLPMPTDGSQSWLQELMEASGDRGWTPVADHSILSARGFQLALPLTHEYQRGGMLLIDGPTASLTVDARSVLEVLAGQIAIAIEDCRLAEENLRLERRVEEGERLATLGQMAATVAHEIKNPLSAIKSIAQVMREDEGLSKEYAQDLNLIVKETDRLSQSLTQLLSFARKDLPAEAPQSCDELIRSVLNLFRLNADERHINLMLRSESNAQLDGFSVVAIRDALANLLLNALQATPINGRITITSKDEGEDLSLIIEDDGPGIPVRIQKRIWEPFFTTKQRGTGLGLAIVQKRMEEIGGSVSLRTPSNGRGARFELRVARNRDSEQ